MSARMSTKTSLMRGADVADPTRLTPIDKNGADVRDAAVAFHVVIAAAQLITVDAWPTDIGV